MARLATGSRPPHAGDGPGLVERLLPPGVAGVIARIDGPLPPWPHPAEAPLVAAAAPRRRREFLVGRTCAHAALAAIGCDDGPIAVGPRREPLWPSGVVGSIAHGGDWACAVVARATHARGLGIDIEPLEPSLSPGVENLVLTPAERMRLPGDRGLAAKVVFSAKECVYKALYPSTGWALEFSDVEIDLDLEARRWRATLDERFPLDGRDLAGRVEVADGHLFTVVLRAIFNT